MTSDLSSYIDAGNGKNFASISDGCGSDNGGGGNGGGSGNPSCGCPTSGGTGGPPAAGGGTLDWTSGLAQIYATDVGGGGSCNSGGGGGGDGTGGGTGIGTIGTIGPLLSAVALPMLIVSPVCTPPAGGPTPMAVPDSTYPFLATIKAIDSINIADTIAGLTITCRETGASQTYDCSDGDTTFYFSTNALAHFTVQSGTGLNCGDGHNHSYLSASNSFTPGHVTNPHKIAVTQV